MLTPLLALLTLAPAPSTLPVALRQDDALQHREVRVLDLAGSPYERGLAHGTALKAEIREIVGDFMSDLEGDHGVERSVFVERFLATTDFMPAIEEWTPGLLDEVRGIADGAQMPFEEIYVWQLGDEVWSMGKWALREKCTAVAVGPRGDQPTIVAQNMDIPGFYQKYPTLLRIRNPEEGRPDTMVFTCPGLIGVNGMNSASVAIACNTLLQLAPSPEGVPCLFVVRGVLERASLAEAEAWLKAIPHAVGQNYTIGDPTGARAFECSAGDKVRFQPGGDFTYHTNHPLVNRDWHPDYLEACDAKGTTPENGLRRCRRFESLEARFPEGREIDVPTIRDALASRDDWLGPICGDWNYGCTVFLLEEGSPELQLAPGRPDRYGFQSFGF
jgi:hypothetical protein